MEATQALLVGLGCLQLHRRFINAAINDVQLLLLHVQAAVVGLTCRTDAIELLEKRVRSRFSHRRQLVLELTAGNTPGELQMLVLLPARLKLVLTLCTDLVRVDEMTWMWCFRRGQGGRLCEAVSWELCC